MFDIHVNPSQIPIMANTFIRNNLNVRRFNGLKLTETPSQFICQFTFHS